MGLAREAADRLLAEGWGVEGHLLRAFAKLGVTDRTQLRAPRENA